MTSSLILLSAGPQACSQVPLLFAWLGAAVPWLLDHEGGSLYSNSRVDHPNAIYAAINKSLLSPSRFLTSSESISGISHVLLVHVVLVLILFYWHYLSWFVPWVFVFGLCRLAAPFFGHLGSHLTASSPACLHLRSCV